VGEDPAAVGRDDDAADHVGERSQRPDDVEVAAGIGEECAAAIIEAAAVDEQRLVAIIERRPLDVVLVQVQLGNALGESVEQFEAVGVGTIHCPQSERCSGRNGGSPTPAARRLRGRSWRCSNR
jgi:hypothetical protein